MPLRRDHKTKHKIVCETKRPKRMRYQEVEVVRATRTALPAYKLLHHPGQTATFFFIGPRIGLTRRSEEPEASILASMMTQPCSIWHGPPDVSQNTAGSYDWPVQGTMAAARTQRKVQPRQRGVGSLLGRTMKSRAMRIRHPNTNPDKNTLGNMILCLVGHAHDHSPPPPLPPS
jgi:hypothetical protein